MGPKSNAAANQSLFRDQYAVDVKFVTPFSTALVETINAMWSLNAKALTPEFKVVNVTPPTSGILISVAIAHPKATGNVVFSFSREVMLEIVHRLSGTQVKEIDVHAVDAAKEMINVILGLAKRKMTEKGLTGITSIPQIIMGHNMQTFYQTPVMTVLIKVDSNAGPMAVEFTANAG